MSMSETKNAVIYLRVTREMYNDAEVIARGDYRTIHDYVRLLIQEDIDRAIREFNKRVAEAAR